MSGEIVLENIDVKELVNNIRKVAREASNEEELKIGFVGILDPKLRKGKYELKIKFCSQNVKFASLRKLFVKGERRIKKSKNLIDIKLDKF